MMFVVSTSLVLMTFVAVILGFIQGWRASFAVFIAALVLGPAVAAISLALPDTRAAAIALTAGGLGVVLLMLAAAALEIVTGREL